MNNVYIVVEDYDKLNYQTNTRIKKTDVEPHFFSSKEEAQKYITENVFCDFKKLPEVIKSETGRECKIDIDKYAYRVVNRVFGLFDTIYYTEEYNYRVMELNKFCDCDFCGYWDANKCTKNTEENNNEN